MTSHTYTLTCATQEEFAKLSSYFGKISGAIAASNEKVVYTIRGQEQQPIIASISERRFTLPEEMMNFSAVEKLARELNFKGMQHN